MMAHRAELRALLDVRAKALAAERQQGIPSSAYTMRRKAERELGALLKTMQANGQRATGYENLHGNGSGKLTLQDLGISKSLAREWQQIALVPQNLFEERIRKGLAPAPRQRRRRVRVDDTPSLADGLAPPAGFRDAFLVRVATAQAGAEDCMQFAALHPQNVTPELIEHVRVVVSNWQTLLEKIS